MAPGWDAAEYAADCHFCGALSKKVYPLFGGVLFLRKKAEPVRVLPQAFFMVFTSCFARCGQHKGRNHKILLCFFERSKGVCFKEKPLG